MKKIENFINVNYFKFIDLEDSEVIEMNVNEFDNEIVGYLFKNYRFDYKGICVYLIGEKSIICIENMNS